MLVREEYKFVAKLVTEKFIQRVGHGCLLLGQTGIGKSTFGRYFLIDRILHGHPTYLRRRSGFYCFTKKGFKFAESENDFTKYLVKGGLHNETAILLVDSNDNCDIPQSQGSEFFTVLITSPATYRYKEFQKQTKSSAIWMAPWSWEEVYCTGQAMYNRGHDALWDIFNRIGPTIRPAAEAGSGLLDILWMKHENMVVLALENLKKSGSMGLRKALEVVHSGTGISEERDTFPSAIFIIKPKEQDEARHEYIIDTVTRAMADHLLDWLGETLESEAEAFDYLFSSHSATTCSRGSLFEARFLRFAQKKMKSGSLEYTPRFLPPSDNPNKVSSQPQPFRITFGPHTTIYNDEVSKFDFGSAAAPFIFIPAQPNQATWDLLGHMGDLVVIGQASSRSSHRLILAGLDDIKRLTRHSLADHRFWKIIFIVPKAVEPSWKHAMPISKGKAKKYRERSTAEYEDIEHLMAPDAEHKDDAEETDFQRLGLNKDDHRKADLGSTFTGRKPVAAHQKQDKYVIHREREYRTAAIEFESTGPGDGQNTPRLVEKKNRPWVIYCDAKGARMNIFLVNSVDIGNRSMSSTFTGRRLAASHQKLDMHVIQRGRESWTVGVEFESTGYGDGQMRRDI
ncbi:hypothetical protein DFH06DRAFT_1127509 [Mycena polygramma]|nr:hypothetical protein DFH06DRAFT_1127509 [Mycena polygramma]